jgi:glutathione S-transferase
MKLELCELGDGDYGLQSFSPFCEKIHRALRFHRLPYTRKYAGRPSEHKALNPSGQVPVLLINGQPLADSTAILLRLEELSTRTLLPADPQLRADAWMLEDFADSVMAQYIPVARWLDERHWPLNRHVYSEGVPKPLKRFVENMVRGRVAKAYAKRDVMKQGIDTAWVEFQRQLDNLNKRAPAREFWLGEMLSVGDIGLFAALQELRIPLTPWHMEEINKRRTLAAWLDRVAAATVDSAPRS